MSQRKEYPIAVVVRMTGLTAHVIRKWEQRYQVVAPSRSQTGRRLYSQKDIERLSLLRRVVQKGHTIGQIARLPDETLQEYLRAEAPGNGSDASDRLEEIEEIPLLEGVIERCIEAVERLDARALRENLKAAKVDLGQIVVIDRIVPSLMRRLGQMWQRGTLRVAQEHLASAVMGSFLSQELESIVLPYSAPKAIITTVSQQQHDLGAMAAAVVAASVGWNAVFLGPDTPVEEIAAAANSVGAGVVLLSYTYPADSSRMMTDLSELRRFLSDTVHIIVGGEATAEVKFDSGLKPFSVVRDLPALRDFLRTLTRKNQY
jgi:DNA-binding transcriptional MerR regulator/methylmalonyl-CoA mutase cobalamin-binding subunit